MNSDSAKSGFKTFILTLSVSLIVFSVVYYLVSNSNTDSDAAPYQASTVTAVPEEAPQNVLAAETESVVPQEQVAEEEFVEEETTVFGSLADKPLAFAGSGSAAVLAGATSAPTDESTTTGGTVPETGLVGITAGLLVSLVFFLTGMYYISSNPRKLALSGFEKKILKEDR